MKGWGVSIFNSINNIISEARGFNKPIVIHDVTRFDHEVLSIGGYESGIPFQVFYGAHNAYSLFGEPSLSLQDSNNPIGGKVVSSFLSFPGGIHNLQQRFPIEITKFNPNEWISEPSSQAIDDPINVHIWDDIIKKSKALQRNSTIPLWDRVTVKSPSNGNNPWLEISISPDGAQVTLIQTDGYRLFTQSYDDIRTTHWIPEMVYTLCIEIPLAVFGGFSDWQCLFSSFSDIKEDTVVDMTLYKDGDIAHIRWKCISGDKGWRYYPDWKGVIEKIFREPPCTLNHLLPSIMADHYSICGALNTKCLVIYNREDEHHFIYVTRYNHPELFELPLRDITQSLVYNSMNGSLPIGEYKILAEIDGEYLAILSETLYEIKQSFSSPLSFHLHVSIDKVFLRGISEDGREINYVLSHKRRKSLPPLTVVSSNDEVNV
jgi:hypothetical protein